MKSGSIILTFQELSKRFDFGGQHEQHQIMGGIGSGCATHPL